MLDKDKVMTYLAESADDSNSELDRFLQNLLILIEFGKFDVDIESYLTLKEEE